MGATRRPSKSEAGAGSVVEARMVMGNDGRDIFGGGVTVAGAGVGIMGGEMRASRPGNVYCVVLGSGRGGRVGPVDVYIVTFAVSAATQKFFSRTCSSPVDGTINSGFGPRPLSHRLA